MRVEMGRGLIVWVMLVMLAAVAAQAHGASEVINARAAVSSEPVAREVVARIAVEVTIDPKYHIQSATPLDPFLIATRVKVSGGEGVTAGAAKYPVAEKIAAPEGASTQKFLTVYSGTIYILLPVTVAADAPLGPRTLTVALTAQACDDKACLAPRTLKMAVPITVAEAGAAMKANEAALFAAADKQAYAEEPGAVTSRAVVTSLATGATAAATEGGGTVKLLSDEEQLRIIASRPYSPYNAAEQEYPLYVLILLALAGGAILNVMPCVLPVIPLKVLSLVQQAHGDRRLAVMHGLVFSAGVVTLFVLLAIVLRTFGLFYGQQFQSVGFLIALVMFVVALALSMLGVWTINPPQALYAVEAKISEGTGGGDGTLDYARPGMRLGSPHGSYLGSFANGLMATLLATPCSAPFLGGVLAWALVQPTLIAALVLALVGVGMSVPYLILAMFPGLLAKVPRAGRWSELLKQGLGIVMIGVAVYLITLIPNATYWPWVLLGAVVVALVCWGWGQIPSYNMSPGRIWTIRGVAVAIGVLAGIGLYVLAGRGGGAVMGEPAAAQDGQWRAFNVALLDEGLAQGRPVVVDWTASWCINCRVLEAVVLNTETVQGAFREKNALLLRADLTRDNPPATLLNRELGGEAIPVLAIFSPSRPYRPVVLRDSYTKERVRDELRMGNGE